MSATASVPNLVFRADSHTCALALSHIVEVLRPLPVKPLGSAPRAVAGLSVIRGQPVVVVDLAVLLGGDAGRSTRFVVLRLGERRIALSVDTVLGVRIFSPSVWNELPPLLRQASPGVVEAVSALDQEAMLLLNTGSLVPDAVWQTLAGQEA